MISRRSFITSTLQALALVGAVKLGLGNMTAEDVEPDKWASYLTAEFVPSNGVRYIIKENVIFCIGAGLC